MLLHPEILSAAGAERDRSRVPAHAGPGRSRRRPARLHGAAGAGGAPGPSADALRTALIAALLGRRRSGAR